MAVRAAAFPEETLDGERLLRASAYGRLAWSSFDLANPHPSRPM